MTRHKKSKSINHYNYLQSNYRLTSKHDIHQNSNVINKLNKSLSNSNTKNTNKNALLVDTTPDPNYNEIEDFVTTLLKQGYDLIDILILAREEFETDKLDSYLYEMRSRGLI